MEVHDFGVESAILPSLSQMGKGWYFQLFMLYVAAEALANFVTDEELAEGKVFPHISNIREVSHRVAVAVVKEAFKEGQAHKISAEEMENIEQFVAKKMYDPVYVPIIEKRNVSL